MAALIWLIVGVLLIAAEVLTGDLTLAMLGVAALGLLALAKPVLRKRLHAGHHVKTNVDALVGKKAIVISTVDAHKGQVKLDGEVWSARAYDETQVLEPGRSVMVMDISGATAVVWGD